MRYVVFGAVAAATVGLFPAIASATPAPMYQWNGLYGGAQVGYSLGGSAETNVLSPSTNPWRYGSEGASAGLFAGYNHAFGNWVGGVEVEGNRGSLAGHYYDTFYGTGPFYTQDWSTAERVRLGYLANLSTLFYGSIGLAQGDVNFSNGYFAVAGYDALDEAVNGVQVGAGVEAFVTPNLSMRVEGAFTHYSNADVHYNGILYYQEAVDTLAARLGIVYHPGWLGGPTMATASAPTGWSWAGMYVGGQVGAMMLNDPEDYNPGFYIPPYDPSYSMGSQVAGSVGTYAGYNWQMGNIVAGIEAGAELPNLSVPYSTYTYVNHAWSAGVRGRLGFVTAGNTLLYGSVGWTLGHFDYSGYFTSSSYSDDVFTDSGLQIGLGAEAFLTSRLSMRFETVYTQYGTHDILYNADPYWNVSPHTLEARIGLTYHLK